MKNKFEDLFCYIVLFTLVILAILYIYYLNQKKLIIIQNKNVNQLDNNININTSKKIESFTGNNTIVIPNNFYDLTTDSPILKKTSSGNNIMREVGGSNICIYKTNSDNNKLEDVECISSGILNNALKLPGQRRHEVCIDEECLNVSDAKFLLGDTNFQLKLFKTPKPNQHNYKFPSTKCVKFQSTPLKSCSGADFPGGAKMLGVGDCYYEGGKNSESSFTLSQNLGMSYDTFKKLGVNDFDAPITGIGGQFTVEPKHE